MHYLKWYFAAIRTAIFSDTLPEISGSISKDTHRDPANPAITDVVHPEVDRNFEACKDLYRFVIAGTSASRNYFMADWFLILLRVFAQDLHYRWHLCRISYFRQKQIEFFARYLDESDLRDFDETRIGIAVCAF